MARWQDSQLASFEYNDGANRLCLDLMPEDDENYSPEHPYRLVWRGDERSPDTFINRPAYFNWEVLGVLIRQALDNGRLTFHEFQPFLEALIRPRP